MSKPPLFFIVIIGLIIVAASFRFMQQRREKADNDMAPLQQKLVEMCIRDRSIDGQSGGRIS